MISLELDGAVAKLTLSRAPVNAMSDDWIDLLHDKLSQIEAASAVSVLWIRSDMKVFSAGADLALMRTRFDSEAGRQAMIGYVRQLQSVFARLEKLPLVSLAEIDGAALGGGFELTLACDLRIVSDRAKVGLPEAPPGVLPGAGGTQRLTRLCGDAVARRLILGAEVVGGEEALKLGIAHWLAPEGGIERFAGDAVARISSLPRHAIAECKSCIEAALSPAEDGFEREVEGTGRLFASDATQNKIREFLERKST